MIDLEELFGPPPPYERISPAMQAQAQAQAQTRPKRVRRLPLTAAAHPRNAARLTHLFAPPPYERVAPATHTRMRTALVGRVPLEVLSRIMACVPAPSLPACAAVNTVWASLALPALYSTLRLDPSHWPTFGNHARHPRRWQGWRDLVEAVHALEVAPHRGCLAVPLVRARTAYMEDNVLVVEPPTNPDVFCSVTRLPPLPVPILPRVDILRVRIDTTLSDPSRRPTTRAHFCPAIRAGARAPTLVVYTCLLDATPCFRAGPRSHVAVVLRAPEQWPTALPDAGPEVTPMATPMGGFIFPWAGLVAAEAAEADGEEEDPTTTAAKAFAAWLPPGPRVTIVFLNNADEEWTPQAWEHAAPLLRETGRVLGSEGDLTVVGAEQLLQVDNARPDVEDVLTTAVRLHTHTFNDWLESSACTEIFDVGDVAAAHKRRRRHLRGCRSPTSSVLPPPLLRRIFRLAPSSELAQYALVNSAWTTAALPLLYENLIVPTDLSKWPFDPNQRSGTCPRRWPSPRDLVSNVRALHIKHHPGMDRHDDVAVGCESLWVPDLPNLQTLHLHLSPYSTQPPAQHLHSGSSSDAIEGLQCPAEVAGARVPTLVLHNVSLMTPSPPAIASLREPREHIAFVFTRPYGTDLDDAREQVHGPRSSNNFLRLLIEMDMREACAFAQSMPATAPRISLLFITQPRWPNETSIVHDLLHQTSNELSSRDDPPLLTVVGVAPPCVRSAMQPLLDRGTARFLSLRDWLLKDEEWRAILTESEVRLVLESSLVALPR